MTTLTQAGQDAEYLTAEREADLVAKMRAGCERSRSQLILSHVKLATAAAAKKKAYGDFDDLLSSAMVGLCKGVDRFNPERSNGARLSTYLAYWVTAEINEYLMSTRSLVKIGTTSQQKAAWFNLNKTKARLGINGNNLTADQITALATEMKIPETVVAEMNARLQADVSLSMPITNKDGVAGDSLQDLLEDPNWVPQDQRIIEQEESRATEDTIADALDALSDRERMIVMRRTLADDGKATLQELSDELGVSRERVRQVGETALAKIERHVKGEKTPRVRKFKVAA